MWLDDVRRRAQNRTYVRAYVSWEPYWELREHRLQALRHILCDLRACSVVELAPPAADEDVGSACAVVTEHDAERMSCAERLLVPLPADVIAVDKEELWHRSAVGCQEH